jgi:DNA mismatch repair ATPase MutS
MEMVSKGTYTNRKYGQSYEPKYILTYRKYQNIIGVTFFDITTLKIFVGQFEDDENLQKFRTLICQIRPVEIVQEKDCNSQIQKMLKNSPVLPSFTNLHPTKCWGFIRTCAKMECYLGPKHEWPEVLQNVKDFEQEVALQSFGMAIAFLEDSLIAEKTLKTGIFSAYTPETQEQLEYMVLDS